MLRVLTSRACPQASPARQPARSKEGARRTVPPNGNAADGPAIMSQHPDNSTRSSEGSVMAIWIGLGAVVVAVLAGVPIWGAVPLGIVIAVVAYQIDVRRGGGVLSDEDIERQWGAPVLRALSFMSFGERGEVESMLRQARPGRSFDKSYVFRDPEDRLRRDTRVMELAGWNAEVETREGNDGTRGYRATFHPPAGGTTS